MHDDPKSILRDRAFVISAVILLVSALGIQATTQWMKLHFRKLELPLRKSLRDFDATRLWPYRPREKARLSADVEEALGTKEYYQARLEDTGLHGDEGEIGRYVSLFLTYYTGDPDQVPHVPEVCYQGAGFEPAGAYDRMLPMPGLGIPGDTIPIRVLLFKDTRSIAPLYQTVVYFFSVNGAYLADRQRVRLALADIRWKYAYFSKVELSFITADVPPEPQVLAVAGKLFNKVLPVLIHEHWQDWSEVIKR